MWYDIGSKPYAYYYDNKGSQEERGMLMKSKFNYNMHVYEIQCLEIFRCISLRLENSVPKTPDSGHIVDFLCIANTNKTNANVMSIEWTSLQIISCIDRAQVFETILQNVFHHKLVLQQ